MARKRPALQFRVRSGTLSELLIELHRGDLDLLFTVLDERTKGADLKTSPVFEDHFVLVDPVDGSDPEHEPVVE